MAAVPSAGRATGVEPAGAPEAAALQRLYERHSRRIFGYCLATLRSREDADDAVQTTFVYALGGLRRGVVPNTEAAWLLKIARNVCLARLRASRRRRQFELAREPDEIERSVAAPESIELVGIEDALAELPEPQRRAILLREWQGRSYAEIAQELGVSRPSVEALIFRARRSLAGRLRSANPASFAAALKSPVDVPSPVP